MYHTPEFETRDECASLEKLGLVTSAYGKEVFHNQGSISSQKPRGNSLQMAAHTLKRATKTLTLNLTCFIAVSLNDHRKAGQSHGILLDSKVRLRWTAYYLDQLIATGLSRNRAELDQPVLCSYCTEFGLRITEVSTPGFGSMHLLMHSQSQPLYNLDLPGYQKQQSWLGKLSATPSLWFCHGFGSSQVWAFHYFDASASFVRGKRSLLVNSRRISSVASLFRERLYRFRCEICRYKPGAS